MRCIPFSTVTVGTSDVPQRGAYRPAILLAWRGDMAKIVTRTLEGTPAIFYAHADAVEPLGLNGPLDISSLIDLAHVIGGSGLEKARNTTHLVRKQIIDRRGRRTTVLIDPNKDKSKEGKLKRISPEEKFEKLANVEGWKGALTPTEDQYRAILGGDMNSMGAFLQTALFKPIQSVPVKSRKTPLLILRPQEFGTAARLSAPIGAKSFSDVIASTLARRMAGVGPAPAGFEPEDVVQETALKLLDMQGKGRFTSASGEPTVPRDKFAAFIATTLRRTAMELLRRADKGAYTQDDLRVIGADIADLAGALADKRIESAADSLEMHETAKAVGAEINKVFVKMPQINRDILTLYLAGNSQEQVARKTNKTTESVKQVHKRALAAMRGAFGVATGKNIPATKESAKALNDVLANYLKDEIELAKNRYGQSAVQLKKARNLARALAIGALFNKAQTWTKEGKTLQDVPTRSGGTVKRWVRTGAASQGDEGAGSKLPADNAEAQAGAKSAEGQPKLAEFDWVTAEYDEKNPPMDEGGKPMSKEQFNKRKKLEIEKNKLKSSIKNLRSQQKKELFTTLKDAVKKLTEGTTQSVTGEGAPEQAAVETVEQAGERTKQIEQEQAQKKSAKRGIKNIETQIKKDK